MSRIEFDNSEGIFYDTSRPIAGEEGQCSDRGQLYEEASESDICDTIDTLETENATLKANVEELERRLGEAEEQRDRKADVARILEERIESIQGPPWPEALKNVRGLITEESGRALLRAFGRMEQTIRDVKAQLAAHDAEVAGLRKALKSFVDDFELDFVMQPDASGTALIVGGPGEMWGPIVGLYEQARSALAASRETEGE